MRFAARTDTTQSPIVKGLQDLGYIVEVQRRPVDLKVRHPSWIPNVWVQAECKTPNRAKGTYKRRTDREGEKEQADYCDAHSVPYWLSLDSAMAYLKPLFKRLAV